MHHNAAAAIRSPQEGVKLVVHCQDNRALSFRLGASGGSAPRGVGVRPSRRVPTPLSVGASLRQAQKVQKHEGFTSPPSTALVEQAYDGKPIVT